MNRDPWIGGTGRTGAGDAPERLFCFPHAGGGPAFFRSWPSAFTPEIDVLPVQLPGREARLDESPYRRLGQLIDPLCAALEPYLDRPYALFGHSMGSLVAYEVARRFSEGAHPAPSCLVVSGRRGPRIPSHRRILHGLPDGEFLAEVVRLGGMPQEIVDTPDLMELLLPVLRADYELSETYRPSSAAWLGRGAAPDAADPATPGARLRCPVAAYMGAADPEVDHAGLRGWRRETTGEFVGRIFPGDHFYLRGGRPDVLRAVLADLRNALARVG